MKVTVGVENESSLKSLSDVGECDGKSLDGAVRILEVQSVGVVVDASELHHLYNR